MANRYYRTNWLNPAHFSPVLIWGLLCLIPFISLSQNNKQLRAYRTNQSIKLDGIIDEPVWLNAQVATDFVENEPDPNTPASYETEVRLMYDDDAIYVGAILYDSHPDSIFRQLTERDQIGITDYFGIVIDAYQSGQDALGFIVTSGGVEIDLKYSAADGASNNFTRGDRSWDAVWESRTAVTEVGWSVEIKIPYMALRFPNIKEQIWNINFGRMIRRIRETSYWNPVLPDGAGILNQQGVLVGIQDITPPLRLSATPYLAYYAEDFYDNSASPRHTWDQALNGGMDIKYGINDAFTLDMTLIPDFGQARSDNQILNLGPFEVFFDENRPFFTEGVELFNKAGLFYSRRIGGRPLRKGEVEGQLDSLEVIVNNPNESRLINATKVSGRTNSGLGIGVFNAVSAPTYATIRNEETGKERQYRTQPLTNYNVVVFDQILKNNSYASFVNTNVMRSGDLYDANVTGTEFQFRNKANSYAISGDAALSQQFQDETVFGHKLNLSFQKISGNFQYELDYGEESATYDPNDLGFLFNNNSRFAGLWGAYNTYKPIGRTNNIRFEAGTFYSRLYDPNEFSDFSIYAESAIFMRTFDAFGFWARFEPIETYDFFEPRTDDFSAFYTWPTNNSFGGWVSSDYRKRLALDARVSYRKFDAPGRQFISVRFAPRFRANDHLMFIFETIHSESFREEGWVADHEGSIIFGRRNVFTTENVWNTNYAFNNRMNLNFRMRHYWSKVRYESFHELDESGYLQDTDYQSNHNANFNAFTIDMVFRWRFALGSDLFITYKNAIFTSDETADFGFTENLDRMFASPQTNSISIKFIYFVDYLTLKRKIKR